MATISINNKELLETIVFEEHCGDTECQICKYRNYQQPKCKVQMLKDYIDKLFEIQKRR